jgi:hypothetical protein
MTRAALVETFFATNPGLLPHQVLSFAKPDFQSEGRTENAKGHH